MIKNNYQKIKAEIFKLSILNKLQPENKESSKGMPRSRQLKNDELGYFSGLENL